jgi:hypothetical protein
MSVKRMTKVSIFEERIAGIFLFLEIPILSKESI